MFAAAALLALATGAVIPLSPFGGDGTAQAGTGLLVEETISVGCFTGDEALGIVRPLLTDGRSTVSVLSDKPQMLMIRTSPTQLRWAKEVLSDHQAVGTRACPAPQGPATTS
jgi:hypothetical protein